MAVYLEWYYRGAAGLGGWCLFLAFVLIASAYIGLDSRWRRVPDGWGWFFAALAPLLLLLPVPLYRLAGAHWPAFLPGAGVVLALGGTLAGVVSLGTAATYAFLHLAQPPFSAAASPSWPPRTAAMPTWVNPLLFTRPQRARLDVWLVDEVHHRYYPLYQKQTTLGRRRNNDVVLRHPTISRQHALIRETQGVFEVVDLGGKGSTFVNQQRVEQARRLQSGDLLRLGQIELRLVTSADGTYYVG